MSTQLRRIAQAPAHSPVRTKFFLALEAITSSGNAGDSSVILNPASTIPAEAIVKSGDFGTVFDAAATISQYALLRDMGRSVTVVAADGTHLYRYRQVQVVSDAATEGVGADPSVYVLVWAADGANVLVARTG